MRRFNPEKELYKIQHGNKNKIILFIGLLLIVSVISYSFALYQIRYSKRIIYTKVAPFNNNYDIELAVVINGEKTTNFPKEEGYSLIYYSCENYTPNYTTITWDNNKKGINLFSLGPNKCNLYFSNDTASIVTNFAYSGDVQEYTVPKNGLYKIELWGGAGGWSWGGTNTGAWLKEGGKGAYTSGIISLVSGEKLYFYVGGKGEDSTGAISLGGYNGGGVGTWDGAGESASEYSGGGGGATDVRLVKGNTWDDFNSLKSRIMVAAGGGGASWDVSIAAGGLETDETGSDEIPKATQTTGYAFGKGQDASGGGNSNGVGGGGGGYYGGSTLISSSFYTNHGFGGSSFISGHKGCDAINNEKSTDLSNIVHTNQPNHYSGKVFTNTVMIDGLGYYWTDSRQTYVGMPNYSNNSIMAGNSGTGYARITFLTNN